MILLVNTWQLSSTNHAAWAGIGLCIFLLLLWLERNTLNLKNRWRDW